MTGVVDRVGAGVYPGTGLLALRGPGAAGDGRVEDGAATGAGQLVEADPRAGLAVTPVAQVLTPTQYTMKN